MNKIRFWMLIFILMISSTNIVVQATALSQKTPHLSTKGNILYVGGSGPGNYTKIQDAIDAAADGDTVFVYDDSSPYKENITISKSIMIEGENKHTTIIDGSHGIGSSIQINSNNSSITSVTIQNTGVGVYIGGIGGTASYNVITDTIILNTGAGIVMYYGDPMKADFLPYGHNTISDNYIKNTTYYAIVVKQGQNNLITRNTITETQGSDEAGYGWGIEVSGAFNNISYNNISNNKRFGIIIGDTYKTVIYRNNIENNGLYGLVIESGSFDRIIQNNFIGNRRQAAYDQQIKILFLAHSGHYPILPCLWSENYWNRPRLLPYIIPGFIGYTGLIAWWFYDMFDRIPANSIRFDLQPAQEPYEIPSGGV